MDLAVFGGVVIVYYACFLTSTRAEMVAKGFPVKVKRFKEWWLSLLVKRVMCSNRLTLTLSQAEGGKDAGALVEIGWFRGRRLILLPPSQGEDRGEGEASFPEFYSR